MIQEKCVCGTQLQKRFKGSETSSEKKLTKGEKAAKKRERTQADLMCPNCGKGYVTWSENLKRIEQKEQQRQQQRNGREEQKGIGGLWLLYWLYSSSYFIGT